MTKRIAIDPLTRLEGQGRIELFLDDAGNVEKAFLLVPELRGFEAFLVGRPAEEMPRLTSKICGVCPTAHHMCATKALDDLFRVDPPPAAKKLRELMYTAFILEDHLLHLFFLGGVDFFVGPSSEPARRNILGVRDAIGAEIIRNVITLRRECRGIIAQLGGRVIHPVCGLPGGVSKPMTEGEREKIASVAAWAVACMREISGLFAERILKDATYQAFLMDERFGLPTHYMGMVDRAGRVAFYDGDIRVIDPEGKEFAAFRPREYLRHIAEHVEPWNYMKYPYLKKVGWRGFVAGKESGVYRVAPLARLNVAVGMATPLAQTEYENFFGAFGGKPVHSTFAFHWARAIEALYAAERLRELAEDPGITDPHVRNVPSATPREGIACVEAPRGTLIHHYKTDRRGVITMANLIVATVQNAAALSLSIEHAAKSLVREAATPDAVLNVIEMAFRAYDPCFACATHFVTKGDKRLGRRSFSPDPEINAAKPYGAPRADVRGEGEPRTGRAGEKMRRGARSADQRVDSPARFW